MSDAASLRDVEWLFFDVFGTVADWKSHISASLCRISKTVEPEAYEAHPKPDDAFWQDRAQEWRTRFMKHIRTKLGNREPGGMDEVHGLLLDELVKEWGVEDKWTKEARLEAVREWHALPGWADSTDGLKRLNKKFILSTLTNGDTAVMIKMCRRSQLTVDNHITGDTIGTYKPDKAMYLQAIRLSRLDASKVAMVAAHAYDLDAAKSHGMRTIYIKRPTEDASDPITEESAKGRFDMFIDIGGEENGGLVALAEKFGL